jgi:hypothetical protein
MSKGVVHQVAAGGFGTGTNDLVRLHSSPPTFAKTLELTMGSTTEPGLHIPLLLFKLFTIAYPLPVHSPSLNLVRGLAFSLDSFSHLPRNTPLSM